RAARVPAKGTACGTLAARPISPTSIVSGKRSSVARKIAIYAKWMQSSEESTNRRFCGIFLKKTLYKPKIICYNQNRSQEVWPICGGVLPQQSGGVKRANGRRVQIL